MIRESVSDQTPRRVPMVAFGRMCRASAHIAVVALALTGCERAVPPPTAYAPGLGKIMTFTQFRHAKLWAAGEAENWALAAYEVDELDEGFQDAVTYHPTHKESRVPLAKVLPAVVTPPLAALRAAIGRHDKLAFESAFDELTTACNACHRAMNFAFNVVRRPSAAAFFNQDFAAPKAANTPP